MKINIILENNFDYFYQNELKNNIEGIILENYFIFIKLDILSIDKIQFKILKYYKLGFKHYIIDFNYGKFNSEFSKILKLFYNKISPLLIKLNIRFYFISIPRCIFEMILLKPSIRYLFENKLFLINLKSENKYFTNPSNNMNNKYNTNFNKIINKNKNNYNYNYNNNNNNYYIDEYNLYKLEKLKEELLKISNIEFNNSSDVDVDNIKRIENINNDNYNNYYNNSYFSVCNGCNYLDYCDGIRKNYYSKFGGSEFKKVISNEIKLGKYLNYLKDDLDLFNCENRDDISNNINNVNNANDSANNNVNNKDNDNNNNYVNNERNEINRINKFKTTNLKIDLFNHLNILFEDYRKEFINLKRYMVFVNSFNGLSSESSNKRFVYYINNTSNDFENNFNLFVQYFKYYSINIVNKLNNLKSILFKSDLFAISFALMDFNKFRHSFYFTLNNISKDDLILIKDNLGLDLDLGMKNNLKNIWGIGFDFLTDLNNIVDDNLDLSFKIYYKFINQNKKEIITFLKDIPENNKSLFMDFINEIDINIFSVVQYDYKYKKFGNSLFSKRIDFSAQFDKFNLNIISSLLNLNDNYFLNKELYTISFEFYYDNLTKEKINFYFDLKD